MMFRMFNGLYHTLLYYLWDYPTNTKAQSRLLFFACFRVLQKRNIKRSPNGMKPSREIFLEKITHAELENHVRGRRAGPRGWGRAPLPWARPLPRGPVERPSVPSFFLYKSTYPRNSENREKTLIPPPYLLFPWRSHLGACSGAPPEG